MELTIDSGYRFVDLDKIKRTIEKDVWKLERDPKTGKMVRVKRTITVKRLVKVAVVEEIFNGKTHTLDQGKTLGATKGDIPDGTATPPDGTKPRRGGRRGGRRAR